MARKTIAQAVENLRAVASTQIIGQRYIAGVQGADWQGPASSPQTAQNWANGVQQAISDGRYASGIQRVSNADWRTAAEQKGGPVIAQRVLGAVQKYQQNFGPILSAMNNAAGGLPARTTSPSQNIQNRMVPVVRAAVEASGKTFQ